MATIFTASRVMGGKKQSLIVLGNGVISTIATTICSYFANVRPTGSTATSFDMDDVICGSTGDNILDDKWPVMFIVKIADSSNTSGKRYILRATLTKTGTPAVYTSSSVYNDMNTAFKGKQDVLQLPAIELNDATVFVEKIILNVLE